MPPSWSYEHDMELGRFLYDHSERSLQSRDCIKEHIYSVEVSSQAVRSSSLPPNLRHKVRGHPTAAGGGGGGGGCHLHRGQG